MTAPATLPLLELRLAYPDSNGDRIPYTHRDSVFYVSRAALLSDTNITAAHARLSRTGDLYLEVWYSTITAARLESSTSQHVGGRMALFVESRLVEVLPISSGAGGRGHVTINTGAKGADAEELAARIRSKWPTQ
jgi:hypothetical protein